MDAYVKTMCCFLYFLDANICEKSCLELEPETKLEWANMATKMIELDVLYAVHFMADITKRLAQFSKDVRCICIMVLVLESYM